MGERIGYAVAVINQASGIAEDMSSTIVHQDDADACWERDLRNDEAREAGRRDRHVVCELVPMEGEDG